MDQVHRVRVVRADSMGHGGAALDYPAATRQLGEMLTEQRDVWQVDVATHDDVRTRSRPGANGLAITLNAVMHFAAPKHVYGLMGHDDPQLVVRGSTQLPGDSLDLPVRNFAVLVARRSRRVDADQQEPVAFQVRLEYRPEDALESRVRE